MTPIHFPSPPRRILIIKPSAIGDVVHTLPVLNLLRRRWPDAHISWLVTPACAGLLERHPQLDEVIRFERRTFGRGWRSPRVAFDLVQFMRSLRERAFDLVIDLQGLFRSGWLAWTTRAPVRVGFANAREGGWLFYTHRVPTGTAQQHAIERYLTVAQALGCERGPVEFHFAVDDADREQVAAMTPRGPYAVLMPGANWPTKQWPVERFAGLVTPVRERFGLESVVAGGPDVAHLAAKVTGAVNLAGKTSLRQLVALLERASLVVANDSGPMHIAAALGRPLVTPYGPTNPVRTGPYGRDQSVIRLDLPCSPCYSRRCSHQSCLQWLKIDPVLKLAEAQMNNLELAVVQVRDTGVPPVRAM
jgi:lipopolysaccharide heptosyltransferase I